MRLVVLLVFLGCEMSRMVLVGRLRLLLLIFEIVC